MGWWCSRPAVHDKPLFQRLGNGRWRQEAGQEGLWCSRPAVHDKPLFQWQDLKGVRVGWGGGGGGGGGQDKKGGAADLLFMAKPLFQ